MISRREFVSGMGSLGISSGMNLFPTGLWSTSDLPNGIGVDPDYNGQLPANPGGRTLGDRPPLNAEESVAKDIIHAAPLGPTPFEVATFFLEVSEGKHGKQWQPFTEGWPKRWNPVIVNFFQATKTAPTGDLTPWCAAFVNWCFLRSFGSSATDNASSGSFRTFGIQTFSPKQGDIVVFRKTHPEGALDKHGHVGLFSEFEGKTIRVLGGNQIEGNDKHHVISCKPYSKKSAALTFHSFRTAKNLQK